MVDPMFSRGDHRPLAIPGAESPCPSTRREFLRSSAVAALAPGLWPSPAPAEAVTESPPIIDTHQHLWDLSSQRLPWLDSAPAVLRRSYTTDDYREATRGLGVVKAIYMEVDVAPEQHVAEAERVLALCRDPDKPTVAAVLGGRPAAADFGDYLARFRDDPNFKGVRQVLHGATTPRGFCLRPEFVRGIRLLGDSGLRFDLCLRPAELGDGVKLVDQCPDTRFILDHCGNADPSAFLKKVGEAQPSHDPDAWRRDIDALAKREHVVCKISGIVAKAPKGWTPEDLAPIIHHCLDAFGPDRVMFGGDWPVCLLGASYRQWVEALRAIVAGRSEAERRKLFSDNARRFYGLAG